MTTLIKDNDLLINHKSTSMLDVNRKGTVNACRDYLIEYIKDLSSKGKFEAKPVLVIDINECGCNRTYNTYEDLPHRSIKCKHGTWLLRYIVN